MKDSHEHLFQQALIAAIAALDSLEASITGYVDRMNIDPSQRERMINEIAFQVMESLRETAPERDPEFKKLWAESTEIIASQQKKVLS